MYENISVMSKSPVTLTGAICIYTQYIKKYTCATRIVEGLVVMMGRQHTVVLKVQGLNLCAAHVK
jgi:hypothetical protein